MEPAAERGQLWSVQLWIGGHLIEEHIGPADLAQAYADVIQRRIYGLPERQLRCIPVIDPDRSSPQIDFVAP